MELTCEILLNEKMSWPLFFYTVNGQEEEKNNPKKSNEKFSPDEKFFYVNFIDFDFNFKDEISPDAQSFTKIFSKVNLPNF